MTRPALALAALAAAATIAACSPPPAASAPASRMAPTGPSSAPATATARPTPMATPTPTPRPAVLPGEPWLAFQSDAGGGAYGIRLVRPDGTGLFFPTADVRAREQLHPEWSPDGSRLVFAAVGNAATDLWVTNADGGNQEHVVECGDCALADEPAWSPDGTTIAFQRQVTTSDTTVSTLELLDVASGRTRVLLQSEPARAFYAPRWSPDGTRLVAESVGTSEDGTVGGRLVVVDMADATPEAVTITDPAYWPANPDWSPDGSRIVFFRPEDPEQFDGPSDLWSIAPDGTGLTRLTHLADDGGSAVHPAYTPDGSRIVFVATSPATGEGVMATVAADGSDLRPAVASGYIGGAHPRFRPTP